VKQKIPIILAGLSETFENTVFSMKIYTRRPLFSYVSFVLEILHVFPRLEDGMSINYEIQHLEKF